jgi:glycosyltransferase involved in cell wall biosynthesis
MAAAAGDHLAELRFASVPALPWPVQAVAAARTVHDAAGGSDAIVLDSIAAAYAAPWIVRSATPVVGVVHQPPGGAHRSGVRRAGRRRLDGIAYRAASGVIAAAESLVDDLRGIGVASDRIVVVPPGCDVPVADGATLDLRRGRGASILCVANWTAHKGILELVEAFAAVPGDAATLWLVGATDVDRRYADRVRRRIATGGLHDRVVVTGSLPVGEVGRLYRSADVFALSSFVDAYGTAWAEAIASGLPVVGFRAGNLPHLAEHGREARMAEPGDVAGLARELRAVVTDRRVRERLARGARRRAETLPTWRTSADAFFAAVRELLRTA